MIPCIKTLWKPDIVSWRRIRWMLKRLQMRLWRDGNFYWTGCSNRVPSQRKMKKNKMMMTTERLFVFTNKVVCATVQYVATLFWLPSPYPSRLYGCICVGIPVHGTRQAFEKETQAWRSVHQLAGEDCQTTRHRFFQGQEFTRKLESRCKNGEGHQPSLRQENLGRSHRQENHANQTKTQIVKAFNGWLTWLLLLQTLKKPSSGLPCVWSLLIQIFFRNVVNSKPLFSGL